MAYLESTLVLYVGIIFNQKFRVPPNVVSLFSLWPVVLQRRGAPANLLTTVIPLCWFGEACGIFVAFMSRWFSISWFPSLRIPSLKNSTLYIYNNVVKLALTKHRSLPAPRVARSVI